MLENQALTRGGFDASAILRTRDQVVKVIVSQHALNRLVERRIRDYRTLTGKVLEDIIVNTIRDGRYWVGRAGLKVMTRRYTLGCTVSENALIVRTVMKTRPEDAARLHRAHPTPWRRILVVEAPKRFLSPGTPLSGEDEAATT